MTLPEKREIAKAARTLRLAQQCIRKVLKLDHAHQALLDIERLSELEATCVILSRAESHIWKQYERSSID